MKNFTKNISKLIAAVSLVGACFGASTASAQVGIPITASTSVVFVDATIVKLLTRPVTGDANVFGFYVELSTGFSTVSGASSRLTCFTGNSPNQAANNKNPVIYSNRPDAKAIREVLELAYALGKSVRVYAASCAAVATDFQYPVIWAVDTL